MKANATVSYVLEGDVIRFKVKGLADLTLDTTKVHADNLRRAMVAGFAQVRIIDLAAVDRADKDGNVRTEAEMLELKRARMSAGIEHLESGSPVWRISGQVKETAAPDYTLVIRAIAQVKELDYSATDALVTLWAQTNNVSRAVLLENFAGRADIAELVRGYRKESAKPIDTDVLLSGLVGGE